MAESEKCSRYSEILLTSDYLSIVLSVAERVVVGSGIVMAPTVPTEGGGGRRRG